MDALTAMTKAIDDVFPFDDREKLVLARRLINRLGDLGYELTESRSGQANRFASEILEKLKPLLSEGCPNTEKARAKA